MGSGVIGEIGKILTLSNGPDVYAWVVLGSIDLWLKRVEPSYLVQPTHFSLQGHGKQQYTLFLYLFLSIPQ